MSIEATRAGFEASFEESNFYNKQTQDENHLNNILKTISIKPGMKILDLGCGSGYLTFPIAQNNEKAYVVGLDIVTVEKLVGPWHLAEGENDDTVVNETFPGAMEFGNSMEITSDGNISWYIGADGGSGSYLLNGNILSADMINDIDGTAMSMEFTVKEKDGQLLLTMEYKSLTLCWSWGETETETGKGE